MASPLHSYFSNPENAFINALIRDFDLSCRVRIGCAVSALRPDLMPVLTVADRFDRAVQSHEMKVDHRDGLYRSITFKNPKSYNNHFRITTWPGHLAITGDSGSYVFARLPDMFEFFRGGYINPCYWGEKLQAVDRHGGYREFSEDRFHEAIKSDFEQWSFDVDEGDERVERAKAWAALQESDLAQDESPESIDDAVSRAASYVCPVSGNRFTDFWDHSLEDHTFRYLWCCHAIQWAIAKYDDAHAASGVSEAA